MPPESCTGSQTREPDGFDRRVRQDPRLRSRQARARIRRDGLARSDDGEARDASGDRDGHRRLHVSGAGRRSDTRLSFRPVFLRIDRLRDGDRKACVCPRDDCGHALRHPARGAGTDRPRQSRSAPAPSLDRGALPGKRFPGTLRIDGRSGARSRECAGAHLGIERRRCDAAFGRAATKARAFGLGHGRGGAFVGPRGGLPRSGQRTHGFRAPATHAAQSDVPGSRIAGDGDDARPGPVARRHASSLRRSRATSNPALCARDGSVRSDPDFGHRGRLRPLLFARRPVGRLLGRPEAEKGVACRRPADDSLRCAGSSGGKLGGRWNDSLLSAW